MLKLFISAILCILIKQIKNNLTSFIETQIIQNSSIEKYDIKPLIIKNSIQIKQPPSLNPVTLNDINFSSFNSLNNFNSDSNKNSNFKNKNLLIGAIEKYDWGTIELFFKSYKKAGFHNCDCVMFVRYMSEETKNKMKSCGVIIYETPEQYSNKKIINYRWKLYEDFLNIYKDKYKLVFTADLRDVFFQKDVFKYFENYKSFLGVSIEDGNLSEYCNKDWLLKAYGEDIFKTLQNERIICVGTVWGTIDKFYEFSKIMWEILDSEWSLSKKIVEQAVCNYLIYHDKLFNDSLIISDNKEGAVMTIGITKRENIHFDSENNMLNGNGEIAAVVHQYNRFRDIIILMKNKYCSEKNNYRKYLLKFLFFPFLLTAIICGFKYLNNKKNPKIINKLKQNKKKLVINSMFNSINSGYKKKRKKKKLLIVK